VHSRVGIGDRVVIGANNVIDRGATVGDDAVIPAVQ
jgi:tetrahydrodipicolinate N-succinyltransferase